MLLRYLLPLLLLTGCQTSPDKALPGPNETTALQDPPKWSKQAVWYEIGVERFRNGDPSNDPTAEDIVGSYPGVVPAGWSVTPWTQDWYADDAYFAGFAGQTDFNGNPIEKFVDKVQARRYGGDLQGVLDKLDYIDSLGITAIYFRPLNDAPSLHKYDARHWRHIDVNFGPDPAGDKAIMAAESPADPTTWEFTAADRMFLEVIKQCHLRGIKVILDYSWNHTGQTFWAWRDIVDQQAQSPYKDWYWVERFDDPATSENEFEYRGWLGVPTLPEIRETQHQDMSTGVAAFEGNVYSEAAKRHIFNVARRWLDPDGDGDPADGVDGYRLDVAAEMPLDFWRDFRKEVRGINPETYLLGEIWWEYFPDQLLDPAPFLQGDIFDAVMNYRWYRAARYFVQDSPYNISATQLLDSLEEFSLGIPTANNYAMMNYTGGFDTPRILTSLFNKNKYKYQAKVHEDANYKIHKPDSTTIKALKLLLTQQFTYVGAPHIYAGDEMGMWGADDPSSRKPLIWKDYSFEAETAHPFGGDRPTDAVRFNDDLFQFYQRMIRMRVEYPLLVHGAFEPLAVRTAGGESLLAYRRYDDTGEILVLLNDLPDGVEVLLPREYAGDYRDVLGNSAILHKDGDLLIQVPGRVGAVLVK